MKVFLDANIIVSVLNKEYPLFTYSSRLLSLGDSTKFEVVTSPICLAIAFYFAQKKSGASLAQRKIQMLVEKIGITMVNSETTQKAIQNKSIHDFEDGLQYYSAENARCNCIVTEDVDDY